METDRVSILNKLRNIVAEIMGLTDEEVSVTEPLDEILQGDMDFNLAQITSKVNAAFDTSFTVSEVTSLLSGDESEGLGFSLENLADLVREEIEL